ASGPVANLSIFLLRFALAEAIPWIGVFVHVSLPGKPVSHALRRRSIMKPNCILTTLVALLAVLAASAHTQEKPRQGVKADSAAAADLDAGTPFAYVPRRNSHFYFNLVGMDSAKNAAVALMLSDCGPAIGYVCDGAKQAVWFEGAKAGGADKVSLRSKAGDTLDAEWDEDGLGHAKAVIAGKEQQFDIDIGAQTSLMREAK